MPFSTAIIRHCERSAATQSSNGSETQNVSKDWVATSATPPRNDGVLLGNEY